MFTRVLFVLSLYAVTEISGFSSGVPPLRAVCASMMPQHDEYKAQASPPPYAITTDLTSIKAGEDILVTLNATTEAKFRGFYIQGRDDNNKPIGSFTNNEQVKSHSCGGIRSNGAHHANGKAEKTYVTMRWTSPKNYQGDITFIGTFVKDFVHIWTGVYANSVVIALPNGKTG